MNCSNIVNVFEDESEGGWLGALHRYQFGQIDHVEDQTLRNDFHNAIVNANGANERIDKANHGLFMTLTVQEACSR